MQVLNLPQFDYQFKTVNGKPFLWDVIRKKHVQITPEEWVRQHFLHYLMSQDYPKSLISVELGHKFNQLQKRSDILVMDRAAQPFLLVECKAPQVPINQKVLEQAIFYNQVIKAPYITLTNGLQHVFCAVDLANGRIEQLETLPTYF
ncbi:MAG: type I restriction enzyme HsdR N-terminal domain-containing protein [Flammeovirgaceae bacterium]